MLKFLGSRSDLISEYGEPNISEYGKYYGQGPYCTYNFLGESGSFLFTRCMPDDASFSNMRIDADLAPTDATAVISVSYISTTNANTLNELQTNLESSGTTFPICVLRPIGRGDYYNGLGVRFTAHSNPLIQDVYVMDVYEKQSDDSDVIIESFEISFDPKAVDSSGDSIWISYVLNQYSAVLRADMELSSGSYTSGYDTVVKVYDKNIGTVSSVITDTLATITDNKQDFSDWEGSSYPFEYVVTAIDGKGNKIYGWLGAASGTDNETVSVYDSRLTGGAQSWLGETSSFDVNSDITYTIKKSAVGIATAFTSSEPVPLKKGSDGSLLDASGDLNTTTATQLLSQGYLGQLTSKVDGTTAIDDILDEENIYFNAVFDCGYPSDVKTSISTLVQTRRDCVAILDNGDNSSYNASITARNATNTFNNYFCALYESYNKVYDTFTGQDVWFSPVYHMSYLLPRNDRVSEIWYAVAGLNRAAIDTIKELRFNPRLGQRDQMYLKQLNPLVKFSQGYTCWGQLTTQAKPSALQDLNIVRLVLYIKKALEAYCRFFIFEQNDAITWNRVSGNIVEFLESIKKKRGLYSYGVTVAASPYELKRKEFHVDVDLTPTRTVERINLNFYVR